MRNFSIQVSCFLVVLSTLGVTARGATVGIHTISDSGQNASSALTASTPFVTTFRSPNDVTVSIQNASSFTGTFTDNFAANPGNNPGYITGFVGSSTAGTGNGTAGFVSSFLMASVATGVMQLDFAQPLNSNDHILFIDVDSSEQYSIQAFSLVGSNYVPLSLGGWTFDSFTGSTGVLPDSRWASWDSSAGTLTATAAALNEELSVLTPDQNVSRLIVTKLGGAGVNTGIQVLEVQPTPEPSVVSFLLIGLVAACHRRQRAVS